MVLPVSNLRRVGLIAGFANPKVSPLYSPGMGNGFFFFFFVSCYFHQSISDYSWEVYIVHSGVLAG